MARIYYVASVQVGTAGVLTIQANTKSEAIHQGLHWAGLLMPFAQTSVTVREHKETPDAK